MSSRKVYIVAAAGVVLFVLLIANVLFQSTTRDPGKVLYDTHCRNCHMENGQGLADLIPPLAGADYLAMHQDKLACIIKNGMSGPIEVNGKLYDEPMPANEKLTAGQISNIINYINNAWENDLGKVTVRNVKDQLEGCE